MVDYQTAGMQILTEGAHVFSMPDQYFRDICRGHITHRQPNDLGRISAEKLEFDKIDILGHNDKFVVKCVAPQFLVRERMNVEGKNMPRAGEPSAEFLLKSRREIIVEEELHVAR